MYIHRVGNDKMITSRGRGGTMWCRGTEVGQLDIPHSEQDDVIREHKRRTTELGVKIKKREG